MRGFPRRLPAVYALRTRPAVDTELEWFFNRAECDMGMRSTFELSLGSRFPREQPSTPDDERTIEAAHAYRRIRGWILAMSDGDAGVLRAAYEGRPWPARLSDEVGRLTGVVVALACAPEEWPADERRQDELLVNRAECLAVECARYTGFTFGPIQRLRREAERRFTLARHAYSFLRGPRPCVVRSVPRRVVGRS